MKVTILRFNHKNLNGRVYTREVGKDIVKQINERKEVFGRIGYSKNSLCGDISLDKVSHVISNAQIVDDEIVCDVKILETEEGYMLKKMIDTNECVFRTKGEGCLDKSGIVNNYRLVSVDAILAEDDAFQERKE